MAPSTRLSFFTIIFLVTLSVCQQCYFPDGTVAIGFKPCSSDGGTCCYQKGDYLGDLCYNNGLCWSTYFGNAYRGACSNKDWFNCTSECKDVERDNRTLMTSCDDRKLCCGNYTEAADCCAAGEGTEWRNATIINLEAVASTTSSIATQPSDSATSSAEAGECPSERPSHPSFGAGIGIGLAVGLGVALITTVLWCLLARARANKSRTPEFTEEAAKQSWAHKSNVLPATVEVHHDHTQELGGSPRPELPA
ncbi:hypothetical protein BDV96DRAFT_596371 [Lophiotrema nucula]|uniref:Mid2 domain-containing protein n=1 Tax=Lophiotrema nucula TaxID=690887 RepID=A0A6A5ZJ78_9PLEO|nr:hypothetical protein BDV96DRAFT_596371 [Lophiotrema nucula]